MRTNSKVIFGILIVAVILFAGCDYIDHPYTVPGPNGCTVVEPTFIPRPVGPTKHKKVLVEDITGHRCGNCPAAALAIDNLKTTYGEQVVAMGLHSVLSGNFTELMSLDLDTNPQQKYIYDFRSTTAADVDGHFGVSTAGLPNGMVNRKSFSGSTVVGHPTWSTHVASELSTWQVLDIQIKNYWTLADSSLCSFYYVEGMADLSSNYKICMYVIEDSIIAWQKDYASSPSDVEFYVHKHVVRTSLNGSWGTAINGGNTLTNGEEYIDGYSINIDPSKWDIDHLYVVAFVYDAATYEVLQAEEMKVKP